MKKLCTFLTTAMLICMLSACASAPASEVTNSTNSTESSASSQSAQTSTVTSSKPAESSQSAAESTQTDILYAVFSADNIKEYPIEYTGEKKTAEE